MSDALSYLMNARPDVMQSYFSFIKKAGDHLDPKTRAIISVITKVDNQTRSGFKQYLVRAMQAGVTPDEVLDALLVAFPTLGLSKIIWAVDILLDMNMPEFLPDNLGKSAVWHDVISIDELKSDRAIYINFNERDLYIYKRRKKIRVYDSHCPHQATNIPQRMQNGCVLTCPQHSWKFDLTTGACIENGDRPLTELEHTVNNGRLMVRW